MNKRLAFVFALLAGFLAAGVTPVRAMMEEADPVAGKQQCYHYTWENPSACSTCSNSCLGSGYVCCTIQVVQAN
jgi:hypothetical protein